MRQYKTFYVGDAISGLIAPNTLKKTIPFTLYSGGEGIEQSYELTNDAIKFALERYYNYSMYDKTGIDNATGVLKHLWDGFITANLDNLSRTLTALMSEYNPLENVERHGSTSEVHSGADTNTKGTTKTTTYNETTDNDSDLKVTYSNGATKTTSQNGARSGSTQYGQTEEIKSNSAFDTNNFADVEKNKSSQHTDTTTEGASTDIVSTDAITNEVTNDGGNSITHTGTVADGFSGSDTLIHGETVTITDTTHGNIGTTMSQQLINAELSLRKYNFIDMVVTQFITHHAHYYIDLY